MKCLYSTWSTVESFLIWKFFKGKSVFGGIAPGKIKVYKKQENIVRRNTVEDVEAEYKRFEAAKIKAKEELIQLYQKALKEVGGN